tara:strand:- start:635 stop:736 length:102 start_codon:yes stop_codon:yes gene_type:complete
MEMGKRRSIRNGKGRSIRNGKEKEYKKWEREGA